MPKEILNEFLPEKELEKIRKAEAEKSTKSPKKPKLSNSKDQKKDKIEFPGHEEEVLEL